MPLEIKELVVKAKIEGDSQKSESIQNVDINHIVNECVDRVFEILKEKEER